MNPPEPADPAPPFLSIVIPCYNEAHRLAGALDGARIASRAVARPTEVLLVDDGSQDDTALLAERLGGDLPGLRVIRRPHRGKGAAVRAGFVEARGRYVFMADADWSMPPAQVLRFLPPALDDVDIAIGSRELPRSHRYREPVHRHLVGRAFNTLVRALVLRGIQDSQCGFKCFRREAMAPVFEALEVEGWAFDVEVILASRLRGLRLAEVPVDWTFNPDSRVRPGADGVEMARDVLRTWRRARRRHRDGNG